MQIISHTSRIISNMKMIIVLLGLMWISHIIMPHASKATFSILPREFSGLLGILTSPFIHSNLQHLAANTSGILTFGLILAVIYQRDCSTLIITMILSSGFGTWLIGRQSYHLGASGLVFTLFAYLLCLGYFQRKSHYILLSITVFGLFNATLFGLLPLDSSISFEGHICGFASGVMIAKFWR